MTQEELAMRLAVVKVLADQVKAGRSVLDTEAKDTWPGGARYPANLPGGRVALVTMTEGRVTPRVVDERALVEYVRSEAPHELVEAVRDSYVTHLKARAADGEVIPGIDLREGDPYPTVKTTPDAARLVGEAWRNGDIDWSVIPQITGSETQE